MLLTKIVETVPVSPDQLYARWADVNTHPQWSTDLEWVDVPSPVQVGSKGQIKPKTSKRPLPFKVTAMEPGRAFADSTPLTLARLDFRHEARPVEGGSEVTVTCRVEGPLSRFWSRLLSGAADPEGVRQDLARLVALIQSES